MREGDPEVLVPIGFIAVVDDTGACNCGFGDANFHIWVTGYSLVLTRTSNTKYKLGALAMELILRYHLFSVAESSLT